MGPEHLVVVESLAGIGQLPAIASAIAAAAGSSVHGAEDPFGVFTELLEDVELAISGPAAGAAQRPDRRPGALAAGHPGADLEKSIGPVALAPCDQTGRAVMLTAPVGFVLQVLAGCSDQQFALACPGIFSPRAGVILLLVVVPAVLVARLVMQPFRRIGQAILCEFIGPDQLVAERQGERRRCRMGGPAGQQGQAAEQAAAEREIHLVSF